MLLNVCLVIVDEIYVLVLFKCGSYFVLLFECFDVLIGCVLLCIGLFVM